MRGHMAVVCAVVVIISCTATGCAQSTSPGQAVRQVSSQERCVRAVFDVLSGMVSRPYDNHVFEDFVTRYGTQSVTYSAYLDAFTPFYDLSATEGVHGAEERLRASITKECAAAR
ncbi:MAG TPA: hypothetical protein VH352_18130 [Pseudonocardiaceae bacterium]|jgi:hypothetical protein|nr:hypothetical protein [Pseudonocardiaceae bacterium]